MNGTSHHTNGVEAGSAQTFRFWASAILVGAAALAAAAIYRSKCLHRWHREDPDELIDHCSDVLRMLERNTVFQL